ncbi:MAG: sugar phosphate isomerase/epimerase [Hyphomicrobiales bacterium]|nr:MAG: sugar phosphate isomerase/epimerase [Hyphomicrobiales bacterium]
MTTETNATGKLPARIAASPTFDPSLPLDRIIDLCVRGGFQSMEVMTSWAKASLDLGRNAQGYRAELAGHGIAVTSLHMPPVTKGDGASLRRALDSLQFAKALGVEVAIYKSDSFEGYAWGAKPVLDLAEKLGIAIIIYNHSNSIIATVEDYQNVLVAIDDGRVGILLEVGHFHAAGVDWRDALQTFGDRVKLVHFKDMRGAVPVPYGTGEINFAELFHTLERAGYRGRFVLELEKVPSEQVEDQLWQAVAVTRRAWDAANAS